MLMNLNKFKFILKFIIFINYLDKFNQILQKI